MHCCLARPWRACLLVCSLLSKQADRVDFLLFTSDGLCCTDENYSLVFGSPPIEQKLYKDLFKSTSNKRWNIRAFMQVACQKFIQSKANDASSVWFPMSANVAKFALSAFKVEMTAVGSDAPKPPAQARQVFEAAHEDFEV